MVSRRRICFQSQTFPWLKRPWEKSDNSLFGETEIESFLRGKKLKSMTWVSAFFPPDSKPKKKKRKERKEGSGTSDADSVMLFRLNSEMLNEALYCVLSSTCPVQHKS